MIYYKVKLFNQAPIYSWNDAIHNIDLHNQIVEKINTISPKMADIYNNNFSWWTIETTYSFLINIFGNEAEATLFLNLEI